MIVAMSSILVSYLILSQINISSYIPKNTPKRTIALLIITSILFAIPHISFQDMAFDIPTALLLGKMTMIGLLLGYIRIKNGLAWSILMHTINNASFMLIPIL